ncbi:LamB/YcsF family protein [Paenibacillus sp. MWE-103]|uniref:5-oxoprolinase subunit A n=1 Tax=Paenibacillus artemisiicola TaxID=1172618 RepID=A0ABS3WF71_9BACL|nr:5-oxoprolinase subunit PxpA [Paenibacillus artemisiicola]MBO7746963.1 LamB/YcsF family protein [Paenibacillus artemisiicola]
MKTVDLNCDLGESFGAYKLGRDEEILGFVTSANVACGFHAGDPATMRRTVRLALDKGVAIGAHPGLQDLIGFGRRDMDISPEEAYDLVVYQIGALWGFVRAEGAALQHVKAHGSLYNMAARDERLALAIAEAVYRVDPALVLYGLAGSKLIEAGRRIGLRTASEVFSDRTYQADGSLTPRRQPDSVITDDDRALAQVIRMAAEGKVRAQQGEDIAIQADTICVHGDGVRAVEFAGKIRTALSEAGIAVQPVGATLASGASD